MKPIESTWVSPPLELDVPATVVSGDTVAGSLETSAFVPRVAAALDDDVVEVPCAEVFVFSADDDV